MKHFYLYRARVVAYPEGSHRIRRMFDEDWPCPVPGWAPPGWEPSPEYLGRFRTDEFIWPAEGRKYMSRSGAKRRAELLESFGATVVLERSSRITWPETDLAVA
jgi:hypothetical protein